MDTKTEQATARPFTSGKTTFTAETFLALPDHVRDCYESFENVKAITVCDKTGWFYEHTTKGTFSAIVERGEYETTTAADMVHLLQKLYLP
jgi:hypothetical protein